VRTCGQLAWSGRGLSKMSTVTSKQFMRVAMLLLFAGSARTLLASPMLALAMSLSVMLSHIPPATPAESVDIIDSVDFIGLYDFNGWLELATLSLLLTLACASSLRFDCFGKVSDALDKLLHYWIIHSNICACSLHE